MFNTNYKKVMPWNHNNICEVNNKLKTIYLKLEKFYPCS